MEIVFRGGVAALGFQFWRLLSGGNTYRAACGLKISPTAPAIVEDYEHYISLSLGSSESTAITGRISESMRSKQAAGSGESKQYFNYTIDEDTTPDGYCLFPEFSIPAAYNVYGGTWVFTLKLQTAGEVVVSFSRMTLRQIPVLGNFTESSVLQETVATLEELESARQEELEEQMRGGD